MGYLDTSDTEIIALTRERRGESRARRQAATTAHEALSFPVIPRQVQDEIEKAWREHGASALALRTAWRNERWEMGDRHCGYCGCRMVRAINLPRTCTVDHRKPRAFGGLDVPENWLLACLECNNRKGTMSESSFRRIIEAENTPRARRLTA